MAADCTGHGVPGAFVSMLGIAFLNEIFTNTDYTASEILENLRRKFKEIFKQENNEIKDGMDAALFIIDKDKNILNYSGANNPLIQLRENIITEHKAAPNCIGINPKEKLFENTFIEIKKDDKYFVFSDGFIDQAGGETGRKITKRKFYELLIEYNSTNIKFTQNKLKEYLDFWMHDTKQTDDILIIGIKI
jgi:serine phosphatase RsbU (regulator of sigma subunit)